MQERRVRSYPSMRARAIPLRDRICQTSCYLEQFKDWLKEKGDNRHSALALWWTAGFAEAERKISFRSEAQ